jgi:hypothetical protein
MRCAPVSARVAVITKATLRLVAAPASVRWLRLFYSDLRTLLEDLRTVSDDRFDALQGSIVAAPDGGLIFRIDAALVSGLADDAARRERATQTYCFAAASGPKAGVWGVHAGTQAASLISVD